MAKKTKRKKYTIKKRVVKKKRNLPKIEGKTHFALKNWDLLMQPDLVKKWIADNKTRPLCLKQNMAGLAVIDGPRGELCKTIKQLVAKREYTNKEANIHCKHMCDIGKLPGCRSTKKKSEEKSSDNDKYKERVKKHGNSVTDNKLLEEEKSKNKTDENIVTDCMTKFREAH